jgi:uncharacterized protein YndB with AHSA1/START domain
MTSAQAQTSLRMTRLIKAQREKVFEAWTRPEIVKQWMGPGPVTVTRVEADARVGGGYRIEMENAGTKYVTFGEYLEVVPNRKLVFTWGWEGPNRYETRVTVLVEDKADGTELTLIHERFANAEDMGRHEHGWTGSLEKLAAAVER